MDFEFPHLDAPRQPLPLAGTDGWVLQRDDLLHPVISGNKWRKLKYFIVKAKADKYDTLITFGGAFSNHLAATAGAGHTFGIKTIGIIRGEEVDLNNPTLQFCADQGMELIRVTRDEYSRKADESYRDELHTRFGRSFVIPEGGAHYLGVNGCLEIIPRSEAGTWDHIALAGGTGTTATGVLLATKAPTQVWVYSSLKGGSFLREEIQRLAYRFLWDHDAVNDLLQRLHIVTDFHFGGYGKVTDELIDYLNQFHEERGVPLDPIYTGKMMFGLDHRSDQHLPSHSKTLVIHTGGLQGIAGINARQRSLERNLILY